jgi:hypothetical protein
MDAPVKLLGKLNAIMDGMGYMQKKSKTTGGSFSYSYVGEAQLKEKLQPLLIKYRIICVPIAASLKRELHEFDKYDAHGTITGRDKECFADVEMTFRLYDCESGEFIDGQFCGTGHDKPGDKAVYKAETAAIRDFYKATFCIPTGLDPEEEDDEEDDQEINDDTAKPQPKPQSSGRTIPDPSEPFTPTADMRNRLNSIMDKYGVSDEAKIQAQSGLSRKTGTAEAEHFIQAAENRLRNKHESAPPTATGLDPEQRKQYNQIKSNLAILKLKDKDLVEPHIANIIGKLTEQKCRGVIELEKFPQYFAAVLEDFEQRLAQAS